MLVKRASCRTPALATALARSASSLGDSCCKRGHASSRLHSACGAMQQDSKSWGDRLESNMQPQEGILWGGTPTGNMLQLAGLWG